MNSPRYAKSMSHDTNSTNRPDPLALFHGPAAHRSAGRARPGKRVLLVDDDSTVLGSLTDVLVAEGYAVVPAAN